MQTDTHNFDIDFQNASKHHHKMKASVWLKKGKHGADPWYKNTMQSLFPFCLYRVRCFQAITKVIRFLYMAICYRCTRYSLQGQFQQLVNQKTEACMEVALKRQELKQYF